MEILEQLYNSEINFRLSCFWDGGFDWRLGDETNGFIEQGTRDTISGAIDALADAAAQYSPDSAFASYWKGKQAE